MADNSLKKMPGIRLFHRFKEGEKIKGMVEFNGDVYVATDMSVYRIANEGLQEIDGDAPSQNPPNR